MAIEKMMLVNIHGPIARLDDVMVRCSDMNCFHPQPLSEVIKDDTAFTPFQQSNPYAELLERTVTVSAQAGITLTYQGLKQGISAKEFDDSFLRDFLNKLEALNTRKQKLTSKMENHENVLLHLNHIEALDVSFDDVFACEYAKVRFGRLPVDSYPKLAYYENEMFFFSTFDQDQDYYWGVYFTTEDAKAVVDNIFQSLYFERIRIPDYVHGTPKNAMEKVKIEYEQEKKDLAALNAEFDALLGSGKEKLVTAYSQIKFLCETFEMRKYVAVSTEGSQKIFYMVGFVPTSDVPRFRERFAALPDVTVNFVPGNTDGRYTTPTKLKNSYFARPFEMFVTMYGMPSQKDIDPTPFVAITYTLLFGIMFGDVGQGLLVSLIGAFVWKKMRQPLGRIMERIGLCSALFGFLYGSVFGYEHLLDPFYTNVLGLPGKPIEVMSSEATNMILLFAIGIGAFLILTSISINIMQGIRQKNIERAVLNVNGVAGFVLYAAILFGIAGQMMLKTKVFSIVYVLVLILVPALLIFFKAPIASAIAGAKKWEPEDGLGGYLTEGIFELFEELLSFATNTMSFLRVGGFVLSHAGMMMVVNMLSEMAGGGASYIVIVLGNLFVICLEGLIVGIQVLRLEFYEIFSRFFAGDGVPFEPIQLGANCSAE